MDWTWFCLIVTLISFAFFTSIYIFGDTHSIATVKPLMIVYVLLMLLTNGTKMGVTTGNNAFYGMISLIMSWIVAANIYRQL